MGENQYTFFALAGEKGVPSLRGIICKFWLFVQLCDKLRNNDIGPENFVEFYIALCKHMSFQVRSFHMGFQANMMENDNGVKCFLQGW